MDITRVEQEHQYDERGDHLGDCVPIHRVTPSGCNSKQSDFASIMEKIQADSVAGQKPDVVDNHVRNL